MLIVTQTRIQLPWNTHKKKGVPRRIATMALPKKEKKGITRRSREETGSMVFTLKPEASRTTPGLLARCQCQGKSLHPAR